MPCSFAVKPCRTVGMTNETNVSTNAELYVIARSAATWQSLSPPML